jgi:hypothetical protein
MTSSGTRESSVGIFRVPESFRVTTEAKGLQDASDGRGDGPALSAVFESAIASVVELLSQHRYLDIEVPPIYSVRSVEPAFSTGGSNHSSQQPLGEFFYIQPGALLNEAGSPELETKRTRVGSRPAEKPVADPLPGVVQAIRRYLEKVLPSSASNCCCCADRLRVSPFTTGLLPVRRVDNSWTYSYNVDGAVSYPQWSRSNFSDCLLQWFERATANENGRPLTGPLNPGGPEGMWPDWGEWNETVSWSEEWRRKGALDPSPTFVQWHNRRKPCGKPEPFTLTDRPVFTTTAPVFWHMLEVTVILYSSPNSDCPCSCDYLVLSFGVFMTKFGADTTAFLAVDREECVKR